MTRPGTKLGPTARKVNTVGTDSAARASTRRHRAAQERETVGEHLSSYGAGIDAHIRSFPIDVCRWVWRWRDHTAGPVTLLATLLLIGYLRITAWYPWWLAQVFGPTLRAVTGLAPVWFTTLTAAGVAGWQAWTHGHRRAATARRLRRDGAPVRDLFRPRPTTLGITVEEHKRVDVLRVPPGHSTHQYEEKAAVATTSLGKVTTIRTVAPGIVAVTQRFVDLLAQPVAWQAPDADGHRLFLGVDSDGEPIWWDPVGSSILIGGMKGSGKSALLKSIAASFIALDIPISGIDLEGGPNFGKFRNLMTEVATDVPTALDMLRRLNSEREANLLVLDGIDAPDAFSHVTHALMIDELKMLTHRSKAHAKEAREVLDDMLARGRKPGFVVVAATQFPNVDVLPSELQGQFDRVIGLRTKFRMPDTNIILGKGAVGQGWDLSTISGSHRGRGLLSVDNDDDTPNIFPFRAAGLYGESLRTVIRTLTERQHAAVDAVDRPLTHRQEPVVDTTSTPTPSPQNTLSTAELQDTILELAQNAGPAGIRGPAVAAKLDVSESRVLRACQHWRDRNQMRTDGTRWYWEGPT